jgi:hypothetical protein
VACFLRAADEMMRSRLTARYLADVAAPRVGLLLLVVMLAHLIFMASPLHMATVGEDGDHQLAMPVSAFGSSLQHISEGDRSHLDCAIQWAASPEASLLILLLAGPLLGWMSGCISSIQKTRPEARANGPPLCGDRQALLQVFRI